MAKYILYTYLNKKKILHEVKRKKIGGGNSWENRSSKSQRPGHWLFLITCSLFHEPVVWLRETTREMTSLTGVVNLCLVTMFNSVCMDLCVNNVAMLFHSSDCLLFSVNFLFSLIFTVFTVICFSFVIFSAMPGLNYVHNLYNDTLTFIDTEDDKQNPY